MVPGVLLFVQCVGATPVAAPVPAGVVMPAIEEIEETTVGDLDGERVPFGNVWEEAYQDATGASRRGLTGSLFLPTGPVRVGAGMVVSVGAAKWRVVEVIKRDGHGVVRLSRESAPQ